jgi:hypothetical protein
MKGWNPAISYNTDGTGNHYLKCNNPGSKTQVAHDLSHEWNPKKAVSYRRREQNCV